MLQLESSNTFHCFILTAEEVKKEELADYVVKNVNKNLRRHGHGNDQTFRHM